MVQCQICTMSDNVQDRCRKAGEARVVLWEGLGVVLILEEFEVDQHDLYLCLQLPPVSPGIE